MLVSRVKCCPQSRASVTSLCTRCCSVWGSALEVHTLLQTVWQPQQFLWLICTHSVGLGAAFLEGSCPLLPFDWSKQVLPLPLSHQHCRRGPVSCGMVSGSRAHGGLLAYFKTRVSIRSRRVFGEYSYMCCSSLRDSRPLSLSSAELTPPHHFLGL